MLSLYLLGIDHLRDRVTNRLQTMLTEKRLAVAIEALTQTLDTDDANASASKPDPIGSGPAKV